MLKMGPYFVCLYCDSAIISRILFNCLNHIYKTSKFIYQYLNNLLNIYNISKSVKNESHLMPNI